MSFFSPSSDPLELFRSWYAEALEKKVPDPDVMALATTNEESIPSVRIVLLKEITEVGLTFFTNYKSRKSTEIISNDRVACVFYWQPLKRQVRVEGNCIPLKPEDSDAYWNTRPRGSQLGALASDQSEEIQSRDALESKMQELEVRYKDKPIPRPSHWGGFLILPDGVEFWIGRDNRLHERYRYELMKSARWKLRLLAP